MPSQRRNLPGSDHSMKERAHELFVEPGRPGPDPGSRATKPFPVYLRETPAQPVSAFAKTLFWILGILVAVMFLAALWRVSHRRPAAGSRPGSESKRPRAEARVWMVPDRGRTPDRLASHREPVVG